MKYYKFTWPGGSLDIQAPDLCTAMGEFADHYGGDDLTTILIQEVPN